MFLKPLPLLLKAFWQLLRIDSSVSASDDSGLAETLFSLPHCHNSFFQMSVSFLNAPWYNAFNIRSSIYYPVTFIPISSWQASAGSVLQTLSFSCLSDLQAKEFIHEYQKVAERK